MITDDIKTKTLVIGSGAGGSLAAAHFASRGESVLVIEEGTAAPAAAADGSRSAPGMLRLFREGGIIPVTSNSRLAIAEGRTIGGSTMVNAGILNRISADVVASWRTQNGLTNLEWDELERCRTAVEARLSAHVPTRGDDPADTALRRGAAALGFGGIDLPLAAKKLPDGSWQKQTMRETYLADAIASGARVMPGIRADRIVWNGNHEVWLYATRSGRDGQSEPLVICAERLVISAGAIQTPLLLRRSGVKNDVGDSLALHPTIRVAAEFPTPVRAWERLMPTFQIKRQGGKVTLGASLSTPATISSVLAPHGARAALNAQLDCMALYYASVSGGARGRIRNLPGRGNYSISYRLEPDELESLRSGLLDLCKLLFAGGATRIYPSLSGIGPITTVEEAERVIPNPLPANRTTLMSIHLMSSVPLGGPLDEYGRLRGIPNTLVCDASMLPSSPRANPEGPLLALGMLNLAHLTP